MHSFLLIFVESLNIIVVCILYVISAEDDTVGIACILFNDYREELLRRLSDGLDNFFFNADNIFLLFPF